MRVIPARLHRVLDFVTIAGFALAPTLFGLTGAAAVVAYALAGVHLGLTLLTRFAPAGWGVIPLRVHGAIELLVGLGLLVVPLLLGWQSVARAFYVVVGVVILVVWALTAYGEHSAG